VGVEKPSTSDSFSRMSNGDTWTSSGALDEVWQTEGGSDNLLTEVCALLSWKYSLGVRAIYGNWFGDSSRAQKSFTHPQFIATRVALMPSGPLQHASYSFHVTQES
jgi:hypothetical protein